MNTMNKATGISVDLDSGFAWANDGKDENNFSNCA